MWILSSRNILEFLHLRPMRVDLPPINMRVDLPPINMRVDLPPINIMLEKSPKI